MICDIFRTNDAISQKSTREEHQRGQENGRMLFNNGEQTDSVQEETVAIFSTEVIVDNEHNRPLLLQERRHRLTEESPRKRVKNLQRNLYQSVMSLLASSRTSKITSLNRDAKSLFRHREADGQLSKVEEKWWKMISCITERVISIGWCIPRFLSEKIFSTWTWKIGNKTRRQILRKHRTNIKIRDRNGLSRSITRKCAPHERVLARRNSGKDYMKRPRTEKDARAEQHDILRKTFTSSRIRTKLRFFTPTEAVVTLTSTSKRPEEREVVVDSGASMDMMSKKGLSSDELDTLRKSRTHTVVLTANGRNTHQRGSTSVRSRSKSVRDSVISRRNACSSSTWKFLRRPRIIS